MTPEAGQAAGARSARAGFWRAARAGPRQAARAGPRQAARAGPRQAARAGPRRAAGARSALIVAALAAGAIAWAALPAGTAAPGLRPVLAAAAVCALFTTARLAVGPRRTAAGGRPGVYEGTLADVAGRSWGTVRALPWPQGLTLTALGLEALHPSRPWHTAVLGVVLLGFLLAVHLAETAAPPSVFRPHRQFLAAGLGLAALSAGAALLPPPGAGPGTTWLAVLAAVAAVIAAALALPL